MAAASADSGRESPSLASQPSSFPLGSVPGQPSSLSVHRNGPLPGKLPKFAPPARIDPFAANESFMSPAQLSAEIRSASPFGRPPRTGSAASGRFRMPPRSATTPHFRDRSPSPEMRIPQDSAFPLFPTKKVRQDRAKKDRERSKSMSRSQSRDRSRNPRMGSSSTSASRSASPAVPQSPFARGTVGPRKSSMSGQQMSPYPDSDEPVPPLPTPGANDHSPVIPPDHAPNPSLDHQLTSPLAAPPVTAAETDDEPTQMYRQASQRSTHFKKPSISAAIKPLDAIGSTRKPTYELGLNTPRSQSASGHRTDTHNESTPFPSEVQSAVVDSRPYPWSTEPTLPENTLLQSRAALPDMPEHVEAEEAAEKEDAARSSQDILGNLPMIKPAERDNELLGNRIRESASSDGSSYSVAQSASSRSSPPTSASSFTMQNDLPRGENIDSVLSDIARGTKPASISEVAPVPTSAPAAGPVPLQQRRRGPAKSFSRPNYTPPQLELPGSVDPPLNNRLPSQPPRNDSQSPSEEMRRQNSRSPRSAPEQRSPGSNIRSPTDHLRSPPSTSPMSPRLPHMPRPIRPGDPYGNVPASPVGSLRRPTTPGFKGNCRGCGEMIMGKSVSSADGRLTGRYHKQCFVCRTCKEPFQTADFYVIDNHPYCHRHYHTLNDSLCSVCDRGIEGPYMETDAPKKFHPHCFTCKECHLILRHDYFEVNGAIYCEKHSKKTDLLGPGRRHPERRTTRLMMM